MKDKRQRLALAWPYADPALATYLLHAAAASGAYPPYLVPQLAPSIGNQANPLTYHSSSHPPSHRFAPYPFPRSETTLLPTTFLRPELHAGLQQSIIPPSHSLVAPPLVPVATRPLISCHLPSCSERDPTTVGSEACICPLLYPSLLAQSLGPSGSTSPMTDVQTSSSPISSTTSQTLSSPVHTTSSAFPTLFQPYKDDP